MRKIFSILIPICMEIKRNLSRFGSLKLVRNIVVVMAFWGCLGCVSMARIDGPYKGRVVDAETERPIAGAVVHGTWSKVALGGASTYYDSYEILSDKNGEFKIPGKGVLLLSEIDEMGITVFKAGYEQVGPRTWAGLRRGAMRETVIWNGNYVTFRLARLSMEQRRQRGVSMPLVPPEKQKLLRLESNRENIELGLPKSTLYDVE